MKLLRLCAILLVAIFIIPPAGLTQPPPPSAPLDTNPIPIPFDGGISVILLAAGVGYAVKKHRDKRKL